jgi:hypothetical protein
VINGHKLNGTSGVALTALKIVIRHAILTMLAMGDLDIRYRGPLRSRWLTVVSDPDLAYGYGEVRAPKFTPTPRDVSRAELIDGWLVWLRGTEGRRALYRVSAWARGVSMWVLAQQEGCSERTIVNRPRRKREAEEYLKREREKKGGSQ